MKDTLFSKKLSFNCNGKLVEFDRPLVMGIINATPDSFYSKSRTNVSSETVELASKMIREGADILDIGGYSSRPGADDVDVEEEITRTTQAIKAIRAKHRDILISIDTFRAEVAEAALIAGANIINDISGGQLDEKIFKVAAHYQAPYILMHMRGTPQNMQKQTVYDDLLMDIGRFFSEQIAKAKSAGVKDIILDPGFGFSKTIEQNFELLRGLSHFQLFKLPVLAGFSRKSTIYKTLNTTAEESLNGTIVLNTIALQNGASILRVHDVLEAVETVKLVDIIHK